MTFTDIKSLLGDFDSKYGGAQPVLIRLPLFFSEVESDEYFNNVTKIFDFFINKGSSDSKSKPTCVNHLCDFSEVDKYCNENPEEDFEDVINNKQHLFGTGETLGDMWINHDILGNQISDLISGMIVGIHTFHQIHESYLGEHESINTLKGKSSNVSDYTFVFLEGKYLNMNMSLRSPDVEDIVFHVTLRHLLAKFIQSSVKMRKIQLGTINVFINNLNTQVSYNPLSMKRKELFIPETIDYPSEYYFGEQVKLEECLR